MKSVLTISFLVLTSCSSFDWQGHRGARGLYPENTIGAMEKALEYPIDTLEFDVVVTKDKKVILSHEPWINPEICDVKKKLNIYKMNYKEVARIDCGSKVFPRFPKQEKVPAFKPLLRDVLSKFKDSGKKFNIEIKSTILDEKKGFQPSVSEFSELVIKEIKHHLDESDYTIQSFDFRVLKYLKEKYPEVRLVALVYEAMPVSQMEKNLGFLPEVYSSYYKFLTEADIKEYQERNVRIIPWTINSQEEMNALIEMGVDGIITDYPDLIKNH